MLSLLSGLPWRLLGLAGGALLLAMLWLRLESVTAQRDAALTSASLAEQKAAENAQAVDLLRAENAKALQVVTDAAAAERRRLIANADLKRKVQDAPVTTSCGPAVAAALDGLRQRAASPASPDRPAGDPGSPAVLSAGAGGAIAGGR